MARIIAVTNTKGGVGKTTTALNLSAALAERGCRVLAVDLDPQASLTVSLGERPDAIIHSIDRSLGSDAAPLALAVVKTGEGFGLVPARHELVDVEKGIEQEPGRLSSLQRVLKPVAAEYDYILLDCPANAGVLTGAALVAAGEVIVPLTPDYLSLRAFDWLWKIVQRIRGTWNPGLHVMGVLLNMYDPRTRHARGVVDLLTANYRSEVAVFSTVIRNSVRLKESAQANKSILRYAPSSEIAQRFRDLAKEVVEGVGETEANFIYLSLERGREALLAGHRADAHSHYRRATEEDPTLAEGWIGRAESAAEWDEQIGCWAQAAHLQPTNDIARAGLDRALEQMAGRGADDVARLVNLAYLISGLGDLAAARRILKRALDLNPSHLQAGLAMAQTTSDPREALSMVRSLLQAHPDEPQILDALENARQRVLAEANRLASEAAETARAGDMIRAADLFRQATELDPLNDAAWVGRGQTSRDWRQAFEFARRALEINQDNVDAQKLYRVTWMPESKRRESLFGRVRRVLFGSTAVLILISAVAMLFL